MRVASITCYPIKSCRGIPMARASVGRRGIDHDRRWMLVDDQGQMISQRESPRLALVDVAIEGEALQVQAPEVGRLSLPLHHDHGERAAVQIWRTIVDAIIEPSASAFFSRYLGRDVRAVFMPEDVRRPINPSFARDGDMVSFADGYPLLLTSMGSLADLNARLSQPVGMERFRPNVVIDEAPPWIEDGFDELSIGRLRARAPKPCDRCVMVGVDVETGQVGKEPLRTLATFRRTSDNRVLFGMNLVPELPDAAARIEIAVGDSVIA